MTTMEVAMPGRYELTDWLDEAHTAYEDGDFAKAAAATQIDMAVHHRALTLAAGENLDGIGNALGDLIKTIERR